MNGDEETVVDEAQGNGESGPDDDDRDASRTD